jgi:NitT/TauT family transport system substrate-binding protein
MQRLAGKRPTRFFAATALTLLAAIGCGTSATSGTNNSVTHLNIRMGYTWASSQYYSEYLVGITKGFYKAEGLDVSFTEGTGSGSGVQLIANGQADMGAAIATGALIRAASKGAGVKMVAQTGPINPIGVISKMESPIKTPQDLTGKKIGMPPGTEQEQIWPAFLKKNSLTSSSATLVSIAGDALPAALQRGQIDGYVSYATDLPDLVKVGMHPMIMLWSDFGVVYAPGEGIVVSKDMLAKKPDVVRAFLRALKKTMQYALDHPDEAAAAGAAQHPDSITKEVALAEIKIDQDELKAHLSQGNQLLVMKQSDWQNTIDLLATYAGLANPPSTSSVFTNDYLPK